MATSDIFYYAQRARAERQRAEEATDERATSAHRILERNYVLKAMQAALLDTPK